MNQTEASDIELLDEIYGLLALGRYLKAVEVIDTLLLVNGIAPEEKSKYLSLKLRAYNRMHWLVDANKVYGELEKFENFDKDEILELALFNILCGDNKRARKYFKQGLAKNRSDPLLVSELALTYEHEGSAGKAEKLFTQIAWSYLRGKALDDIGFRTFGRLASLRELTKREMKLLLEQYKKNEGNEVGTRIAFILAKAYRTNKKFVEEVSWLSKANLAAKKEANLSGQRWSHQNSKSRTKMIKRIFSSTHSEKFRKIVQRGEKFIFVLGMPRSGTTLVEQIIGAHSLVGNAGESKALNTALFKASEALGCIGRSDQMDCLLNSLDNRPEIINRLAVDYVEYQNLFSSKAVITDKELSNIDWLGFLANIFPNSYYVYVERHPLDNCVSLMQQHFKNAPYANAAIDCIKEYYEYFEKAAFWQKVYGERFIWLKYENLITNPEQEIRDLILKLGLEWQDDILDFYSRNNSVRTPSVAQVRQGISKHAVGKWKLYEPLIKPALEYYREKQGI